MDLPATTTPIQEVHQDAVMAPAFNRCYSCALASTEQCLALLRAMCLQMQCRKGLCSEGLVKELALNNLRRGTHKIQEEVRQLLCLLTRDLPEPTTELCDLLYERVKTSLNGTVPLASLDTAVRHEMVLLEALLAQDDKCWEIKFKPIMKLFLIACK
jgi:E3 ubiquitin-protein ligase UBR4